MTLPETVALCDAVEIAAIALKVPLFSKDLDKQLFAGLSSADTEADIKDVFAIARARWAAAPNVYPFIVTDYSIEFKHSDDFNIYTFLLLGRSLRFGGPANAENLLTNFRKLFEDVVSWALRKAGFASEVLSIPREFRGLHVQLAPALRQISERFREAAILRPDRLAPHDNDLDVDVLAVPIIGNATRGGWPIICVQCATGDVSHLQAKLGEGDHTFGTVWETGFYDGSQIRAVATPDDLLRIDEVHWLRLGKSGWVLDRTRIAYLSATDRPVPLLPEVNTYWTDLWAARNHIDWRYGWQQAD